MLKSVDFPIKVTLDSGGYLPELKNLENKGYLKLYPVMLENGRQIKKLKTKIKPIGVYNHSRWGEAVYAKDENILSGLLEIIGRKNVKDAMHLEAHYRNNHDVFVSCDKKDILLNSKKLKDEYGIIALSPQELIQYIFNITKDEYEKN